MALEAYTHANYARSVVDKRSTSGYCSLLEVNFVTRKSQVFWHVLVLKQIFLLWHKGCVNYLGLKLFYKT